MTDLTAREAYDAWQAGDLTIIDVREEHEHAQTRIDGVALLPMSELLARIDEVPDDGPLAIICRSGSRSAQVADYLTANGEHGDVANVAGGIIAWAAERLPYEGAPPT
ncbi:MAG: rhodanese-like domain-containing protein [Thermoleophilia bacterium]